MTHIYFKTILNVTPYILLHLFLAAAAMTKNDIIVNRKRHTARTRTHFALLGIAPSAFLYVGYKLLGPQLLKLHLLLT